MAEYYNPDGTGPFFTDSAPVIPGGSQVVVTEVDGTIGTGVTGQVVTDVQVTAALLLQIKTRPVSNGYVSSPESAWTTVHDFGQIETNRLAIITNATQIELNRLELVDHEARITALEP